jgi:hypothetical protein
MTGVVIVFAGLLVAATLALLMIRAVKRGGPPWIVCTTAFGLGLILSFPLGCAAASSLNTKRCSTFYGLNLPAIFGHEGSVLPSLVVGALVAAVALMITIRRRFRTGLAKRAASTD